MEKRNKAFQIASGYKPAGDQAQAISALVEGIEKRYKYQTLHGATGTGKTFTMANIIQELQKPTLIIAHNKTLAAQLAQEFSSYFPNNAVHYFVSYYDYYQPEAYAVTTDTYIEKEATINKEIDMLRHASTQSLLSRNDVIIVASVSCIYGLGSPDTYEKYHMRISKGADFNRSAVLKHLVSIQYTRTNADLEPGTFRVLGSVIEIMTVNAELVYRIESAGGVIHSIVLLDPVTRELMEEVEDVFLFPAKHFITSPDRLESAIIEIEKELAERVAEFESENKILEAQRLERRTRQDLAMLREIGFCQGVENYSRHLSGKKEGEAPDTLLSYFPKDEEGNPDFLCFIDESHMTIPQISGMYRADASRKQNLVDHGFRLPSARDNRPLMFDEFISRTDSMIMVSATPGKFELENEEKRVEQIIRPTGLVDPLLDVRRVTQEGSYPGQVHDFVSEAKKVIQKGNRVLATTLTKKMAEDLTDYLKDRDMLAVYLHSEVDTLDRIKIISDFRKGIYDVLVGVNLLREGLDMPEVALIGILDADKEGFLRSDTALIQTIGRAARNEDGRVILYADRVTNSMKRAMDETNRRREKQLAYNKAHNITPKTIHKNIQDITSEIQSQHKQTVQRALQAEIKDFHKNPETFIKKKRKQMEKAVSELDFETAAILRDEIYYLVKKLDDLK
ncbi:MAG: excinuclease ABC subunit UvrB [Patescibacteria group bacterium]